MEREKYSSQDSRLYVIDCEPADQESMDQVIEYLHQSGFPMEDLIIQGEAELINTSKAENGQTGAIDYTPGALVSNLDRGSSARFTLSGFDSIPSTPMKIYRGSDKMGPNEVLVDVNYYSHLFGEFYEGGSEDTIYLENGESRKVAGVVDIPSSLEYGGIIVDRNQFFSLTDTCTSMKIVFVSRLTGAEERKVIHNLGQYVSITNVVYPSAYIERTEQENKILILLSRILIFVCILCSMRLMTYLLVLRKQEFSVIRMLGAGRARIAIQIFAMILMISGISISLGTVVYLILLVSRVAARFLPELSLEMIGSDALFMLGSALVIGFAGFLGNNRVDVSRANEEV